MRKYLSFLLIIIMSLFSFSLIADDTGNITEVVELPNYSMKLSMQTTASKSTVWKLWSDVENWKQFDERLEYSFLVDDAPFIVGSTGYVKGKGAPKTRFTLTKVENGESFTEVLKLPLLQTVHLQRYFEKNREGQTVFTHEVNFRGGLKSIYYQLLVGSFKKDLKLVMEKMKTLAELKEAELNDIGTLN